MMDERRITELEQKRARAAALPYYTWAGHGGSPYYTGLSPAEVDELLYEMRVANGRIAALEDALKKAERAEKHPAPSKPGRLRIWWETRRARRRLRGFRGF